MWYKTNVSREIKDFVKIICASKPWLTLHKHTSKQQCFYILVVRKQYQRYSSTAAVEQCSSTVCTEMSQEWVQHTAVTLLNVSHLNTHVLLDSHKLKLKKIQPPGNTLSRSRHHIYTFSHHRFRSFVETRMPCCVSTIRTASPVAPQMSSTSPLTSTCSRRARTCRHRNDVER